MIQVVTNWKTTFSGIASAFMALLGSVAALPYQLGDVATIIPPNWKARIAIAGFTASFALRCINAVVSADKASHKFRLPGRWK